MSITVVYDDPDFSKPYTTTVADGTADDVARRTVTAFALNREFAPSSAPLSKYTITDKHVIAMADLFAKVVS